MKLETNSIRYECHVVNFLNNSYSEIVTTRDQNGSASSVTVHTGHHSALKNKGNQVRRRAKRQAHTAYGEFSMEVHTETSMFAKEALETGKALIDCGASKSMGSQEALDGLARMNEQRHGSTRFSLDRSKKTWYTFANGTRQQSEGEVAFNVNAGGRTGECKINCLNTTGVPILLSVHSLSQMGAIIDFSTGAAFFRHLADQAFVQQERESNGQLYLSLVEDMLSQPILNKKQLQGFQAAAQVLENLEKSEEKHGCLAASSQHHIMHDSDIRQHNEQVPTDTSQTGTTSPDSHTRQHLGPMQHYTTVFAPLTVNTNEIDSDVSIRSRCTQEGRMPTTDGTSGRGATSPWSTGVGTEVHDQGSSFCERRRTGNHSWISQR